MNVECAPSPVGDGQLSYMRHLPENLSTILTQLKPLMRWFELKDFAP